MQVHKRLKEFIGFKEPALERKYIAIILVVLTCGVIFLGVTGKARFDKHQSLTIPKNDMIETQIIKTQPQSVNGVYAERRDGLTTTGKLSYKGSFKGVAQPYLALWDLF